MAAFAIQVKLQGPWILQVPGDPGGGELLSHLVFPSGLVDTMLKPGDIGQMQMTSMEILDKIGMP